MNPPHGESAGKLTGKFSLHELREVLVSSGITLSADKRYRVRLIDMEIVVIEDGSYRFSTGNGAPT